MTLAIALDNITADTMKIQSQIRIIFFEARKNMEEIRLWKVQKSDDKRLDVQLVENVKETETENQIQIGNGIAVSKNDIENRRFRHNTQEGYRVFNV